MKCTVCGRELAPGTGTMFVWNDGRTATYCGSKCKANTELGREPKALGWVRKKK